MDAQGARADGYAVPTYEAPAGAAWYHFLHGNVPGHQIDFIYRPDIPHGALTRQHFSHLARLVKYIEPREGRAYAFAIANLSRDDTQYEPGRGGVALVFGLRIQGATDHAGRQDPPFSHAAAAIERHMDEATLFQATRAFYDKLLLNQDAHAGESCWYHKYVGQGQSPDGLQPLLQAYVRDFQDLPAPGPSGLGFRWTVEGVTPPKRVVIVYPDQAPFEALARCAARIAGVLVESDIRWTSISTGREADVPGGVSIRFIPAREFTPEEAGVPVFVLEGVPEVPKKLAKVLFGAKEVDAAQAPGTRAAWRQFHEAKAAPEEPEERADAPHQEQGGLEVGGAEKARDEDADASAGAARGDAPSTVVGKKKRQGSQVLALVGLGVALAVGGAVAAVALHGPRPSEANSERTSPQPVAVAPAQTGQPAAAPSAAPTASSAAPAPAVTPGNVPTAQGPTAPPPRGRTWRRQRPPKKTKDSVIVVPN